MRFIVRMVLSIVAPPWSISSNKHSDFLFILGSGRSGNTLVRRLLMENASIYIPPETYVLPMIARLRWLARGLPWGVMVNMTLSAFQYHPEFKWLGGCDFSDLAKEACTWPKEKRKIDLLILEAYRVMAAFSGSDAKFLGDKTPLNTLYANSISKLIPGAKYLYIFRDGADVVDSYVKAGIYQSYDKAAKRWVNSVKSWNRFKNSTANGHCVEVRYEDLVKDPEGTINKLIESLSLPRRDFPIDVSRLLGDVTAYDHHSNVTKPPSLTSIGKGRVNIPESEKPSVRRILNAELRANGYEEL